MLRNSSNFEDSDGTYSDCTTSDDDEIYVNNHGRKHHWKFTKNHAVFYDISNCIHKVWKEIGRHLLKEEHCIELIDVDFDKDGDKEKAYQMLVKWHREMGSKANVQFLQDVLIHMGKEDLAEMIPRLYKNCMKLHAVGQRRRRSSTRSQSEIEGHIKLQKNALQTLKQGVKHYKHEAKEIEGMRKNILENPEARQLDEQLGLKSIVKVRTELEALQAQVNGIQENNKDLEALDEQLRYVAEKLHEVEKRVLQHSDQLNDLQLAFECKLGRCSSISCLFGGLRLPRGSTREKRKPAKTEEMPDDVFSLPEFRLSPCKTPQSKVDTGEKYKRYSGRCEQHFRRKLSVFNWDNEGDVLIDRTRKESHGDQASTYDIVSHDDGADVTETEIFPGPYNFESSETIFSLLTQSSRNNIPSLPSQENIILVSYLV